MLLNKIHLKLNRLLRMFVPYGVFILVMVAGRCKGKAPYCLGLKKSLVSPPQDKFLNMPLSPTI